LDTDALVLTRNSLASLLEEYWADIAWKLERVRTRSALAVALKPLQAHRKELIEHLLESDTEKAQAKDIRVTWRARQSEVSKARDIVKPTYEGSQGHCKQAVLALDELLLQNKNQPRTITDEFLLDRVFESFWKWSTAKAELAAIRGGIDALDAKLARQQAYFTQAEMLLYIRERRYEFTPRMFASALAGLPYMSYRQSISRCRREPFPHAPDPSHRLWEFVNRVWGCRDNSKPAHLESLFQTRLERLRKDAYLRDKLRANFGKFRRAIAEALRTSEHPSQVPHLIATLFEGYLAKPQSNVEKFLEAAQDT
jgi:hypothetical protein